MQHQNAVAVGHKLIAQLQPHVVWCEIAGSVRRGKPDPKDIELVLIPAPTFWDFTDKLVADKVAQNADYGGAYRWGPKYRGLVFEGARVELFLCDENNRGWIYFLRTGPGDMNTALVTRIKYSAPFQVKDGYIWSGTRKLHITSEQDWFDLLGIDFVEPARRDTMMQHIQQPGHQWGDPARFILPQTITIYTAQMHVKDPDALDITLGSGLDGDGAILAPTAELVYGHKTFTGDERFVGKFAPVDDTQYTERYLALLRERYKTHVDSFYRLLESERLVLKCYCPAGVFCHRHLAADVLAKIARSRGLNVVMGGEIDRSPEVTQPSLFDLPTPPPQYD